MRTATLSINGQGYMLCFSGRVIRNACEKYGDISKMYEAMGQEDQASRLDAAVWVLSQMIQAGDRYAKLNGIPNPGPLSADELYDLADMNDFTGLYAKIKETVISGQTRHVYAAPDKSKTGKKSDATPGSP